MWPDSGNRWCTSEFKRGPGGRVLTSLFREAPGDILNVYGFRAEESPARAKRQVFSRNARFSTKSREVWDWLPIRDWTKEQVWADIRASGVPHHYAYDFGMSRLSCVFCIFAPKGQLMLAARNNPELFGKYLAAEAGMGHSFRHKLSLREVKEAIDRGEEVSADDGKWNM
jgi:3'-phosphoadenosine 5'-phosphosulfate sulfotransferase (PAPS reductase)/FAD synthetase